MLAVRQKTVSIAIIGGSGFWSEQSHHKHILELKKHLPVKLDAIVDMIDPTSVATHANLQSIMEQDHTTWLNPRDYCNPDDIISHLKDNLDINLVIIASDPTTHFEYGMSCIKAGLNVVLDKPIVSHRNASTDPEAASAIAREYGELVDAYETAKLTNPKLFFHSILRRRSLEPFTYVANELGKVYRKTGAGINNLSFRLNGGICKLPAEFAAPGAHGYLDGVGSLSHSAYHYIDVISWFISNAPGDAVKIKPSLNYVMRIKDYIGAKAYEPIANALECKSDALILPPLSDSVLGSELNSGFTFTLFNRNNVPVGEITFLCNHVSFTPRVIPYDKNMTEPANRKGGGRMSHFDMDINQEGLQSWQISKDDVVFEDNRITVRGRRHPSLGGETIETLDYENAYEVTTKLRDFLAEVLQSIHDDVKIGRHSVIRDLSQERLATQLYGACYELISHEYVGDKQFEPKLISIR